MHRARAASGRASTRLVLALLAVAVVVVTACDPPFPNQDAFYRPPTPLPAGNPGDIIRTRSSVYTLDPIGKTPVAGVRSSQVLYRSVDALGQPMAVTGTVLVPTSPWLIGSRPLVTYAVGTRGLGDQ